MKAWQKKKEWEFIVNRTYTPLALSINSFDTAQKYLDKVLPVPVADIYAGYTDDLYYGAGDQETIAKVQLDRYKKEGTKFLWHMVELCEQGGEKLTAKAKALFHKDFSVMNVEDLAHAYTDICEQMKSFSVFLNYPFSLEGFLDAELSKVIKKYVKNEADFLTYKQVLSEPMKLNEGQLEQISLLTIASAVQTKDSLEKLKMQDSGALDMHLDTFGWLPMRWLHGKPASKESTIGRLEHILEEGNKEEKLSLMEGKPKKVGSDLQEFVREYSVSVDDEDTIRLVKEYVFIRTYRTDVINRALFWMVPMFSECARRLKITFDDIVYLSYDEVYKGLYETGAVIDSIINERKKGWAFFRDGDTIAILHGADIEEFAKVQGFRIENLNLAGMKQISGHVGFAGKIQGRVKIVLNPNDIKKVEKGDILVTVMTFPSYIAAMEKASAFITDEGGILCHAAIVARELKKPCVISTKIATKVLKDGDMVEVDADRGIVSILERAK